MLRKIDHSDWAAPIVPVPKREKCSFYQESVEYLGHHVDASGVHTSPKKVQTIQDAPEPTNVQELRSFLGLVNYYAKFMSNLASLLHPLHELLRAVTSCRPNLALVE